MTVDERLLQAKSQQAVFRQSGRPTENPFHSSEVEADFLRRAKAVVEKYFDPSPENTKKQFLLPHCRLGKTAFWSFIFFYYTHNNTPTVDRLCHVFPDENRPLAEVNLQRFHIILTTHIGEEYVGDRSLLSRQYNSINKLPITTSGDVEQSIAYKRNVEKSRRFYWEVLKVWNEA